MITLTMLIIIGTIIYLVWNHFELLKLFNTFKENRNEFDIKIFDKFVNLENKISNDNKPLIHRIANNEKEINQLRENLDKDVIELNTEIQKIKKSKQRIKVSDFDNLVQRVEKLEFEIAAPAFNSYKIFIAELENHKSKIRTTKGRVSLNKELIVNMIKDGKLSVDGVYSYSQLQTALMEFLQCKKNSTNSKIQRLTNKCLFKKIYSEMGTLYEVNI